MALLPNVMVACVSVWCMPRRGISAFATVCLEFDLNRYLQIGLQNRHVNFHSKTGPCDFLFLPVFSNTWYWHCFLFCYSDAVKQHLNLLFHLHFPSSY